MATSVKIEALHIRPNTNSSISTDTNNSNVADFKFCMEPQFILNVSPNWSSEPAYGKMDDIPFYTNAKKIYNISFTTTTHPGVYSVGQMHADVAKLFKFQYPAYVKFPNGVQVIKSPPFFSIAHREDGQSSLFTSVQGYMENLRIKGGHADKKIVAGPDPVSKHILESQFNISFDFTVLHENVQGYTETGFWQGQQMFNFEKNQSIGTSRPPNMSNAVRIPGDPNTYYPEPDIFMSRDPNDPLTQSPYDPSGYIDALTRANNPGT